MSYNIEVTEFFSKQLKKLTKKYPSLKDEFIQFIFLLKENPKQGTSLGNNSFKIRLAISSKGKGKSGGARIITHIQISETKVFLLSIYDKSNLDNISDKDLDNWIKNL